MVVNYLEREFSPKDTAISFIYNSYKDQDDQLGANIIGSLLRQIVQMKDVLSDEVMGLYRRHISAQTRPTASEFSELLEYEVRNFPTVFVLVDALDECSEGSGARQSLLMELQSLLRLPNTRLMITSRHIADVELNFENAAHLEIRANDDDIRKYLEAQIPKEPRLARCVKSDPALQESIIDTLVDNAKGM